MSKGVDTDWTKTTEKGYDMSCKLNDKDVLKIEGAGVKDRSLGMCMPQLVDMSQVKKEIGSITDLEKAMKDITPTYVILLMF